MLAAQIPAYGQRNAYGDAAYEVGCLYIGVNDVRALDWDAARFEERYGRAPSQRELAHLAQASNFATRAAKEGALDFAQLHAGWADKLARTLGVSLASVAPSVWHGGTAGTHADDPRGPARPRSASSS